MSIITQAVEEKMAILDAQIRETTKDIIDRQTQIANATKDATRANDKLHQLHGLREDLSHKMQALENDRRQLEDYLSAC